MAKLVMVHGPGARRQYPLEGRLLTIGRQPGVAIHLDLPEVSRQHAQITCEQDTFYVEDLGSSNGTFLNGMPLKSRIALRGEDRLNIGPFELRFEEASPSEPSLVVRSQLSSDPTNLALFRQDAASKLRAVLAIAEYLAQSLDLDDLLPRLLDQLLVLFPKADRGLILLAEGDNFTVRAVRSRRGDPVAEHVYSRTVARRVLAEGIGIVATDLGSDNTGATLMAAGIRSFVCTPLKWRDGRELGVLQLDHAGRGAEFTDDDLHLLTVISLQVSVVLENTALHARLLAAECVKRDLALAAEVAEAARYVASLLPEPLRTGPVTVDWRFVPSTQLGGDSFGYHWLDDDHFAVYLLDVSGHGVGASLLSVSAMNVISSQSLPGTDFRDPGAVLRALDAAFPMERHNNKYFTIWYGVYRKSKRQLVWAGGGHPPALLWAGADWAGATLKQLPSDGGVVGLGMGVPFETGTVELPAHARLLLFSDGVYEIERPDGTMWAFDEFVAFLAAQAADSSPLDTLLPHVRQLRGAETLNDDFSMVQVVFQQPVRLSGGLQDA